MDKERLTAIIIAIMVPELKVPHGTTVAALAWQST
jgi:uncharacterized membrane protein